jgi:hypothetical protein
MVYVVNAFSTFGFGYWNLFQTYVAPNFGWRKWFLDVNHYDSLGAKIGRLFETSAFGFNLEVLTQSGQKCD